MLFVSVVLSCGIGGENVKIFRSIPYSWLFPRCAAAIHHAGR